jgi:uncharacterized protein (TIGR03437 family)
MKQIFAVLAVALVAGAAATAASVNTTLTVNASATVNSSYSAMTISGSAAFTGGMTASGNVSCTGTLTADALSKLTQSAPFTITLPSGTLTGTLTVPTMMLLGVTTSGNVTVAVTGGTGSYSGSTGSFTLSGNVTSSSGGVYLNSFSGAGTLTTGGASGGPSITAVLNGASNAAGLAPGAFFIVKGTGLSPTSVPFVSYDVPRPTTSNGVKITITGTIGGSGTDAYIYYLYNQGGVNQLAAVLPSTILPGSYNVTVTNGTVSAPFAIQISAAKPGLFTQDSSGTGTASVQNYISPSQVDLNRLTTGSANGATISPAKPGQTLIAWGSGLGAYTQADNAGGVYYDFSTHGTVVHAVVGGVNAPVTYAGRAGYAGIDQINFVLPANVPTGCAVPFQIDVNGVVSNATTLAIADSSGNATCTLPGYTSDDLKKLDQGGSITTGGFSISQLTMTIESLGTVKSDVIGGSFAQITAYQMSSATQSNASTVKQGSCTVYQTVSTNDSSASATVSALDAGDVSITGPSGSGLSSTRLTKTSNTYSLSTTESGFSIPGQVNFTLPAGTYTLNGSGGTDVNSFNASLALANALTLITPLPATVTRSTPLALSWTGGGASDVTEIIGATSSTAGVGLAAVTTSKTFICVTNPGAKSFTVPATILGYLDAVPMGVLSVASGSTGTPFTATLKNGTAIDKAYFGSFVGIAGTPAYQ